MNDLPLVDWGGVCIAAALLILLLKGAVVLWDRAHKKPPLVQPVAVQPKGQWWRNNSGSQ